jgi:biofilm PGA synthesis N-glycosyltransferase PgaC
LLSLLIFTWATLALYAAAALAFRRALRRPAPATETGERPFVSVVVAARDEEARLPGLLRDLAAQTYPNLEVVVVDDRSSDGTGALVEAAAAAFPGRFRPVRQESVPAGVGPKKLALQRGVEESRGEVVLLTDADCRVTPGWVDGMVGAFTPGVGLVLGYSELEAGRGSPLFERVQAFEFLTLVTTMAASARLGFPLGASGHSLAYPRDTFERVGGYRPGLHLPAGDDMLMLDLVRAAPDAGRIVFADAAGARVRTRPVPTLRDFRSQRARWASSGMRSFRKDWRVLLYGAATLNANLTVYLGALWVAAGWMGAGTWAAAVAAKLGVDLLLYGHACRRFGRPELLRYLPLWFVLQPVYLTAMAVWGLRPRFTWKAEAAPREQAAAT